MPKQDEHGGFGVKRPADVDFAGGFSGGCFGHALAVVFDRGAVDDLHERVSMYAGRIYRRVTHFSAVLREHIRAEIKVFDCIKKEFLFLLELALHLVLLHVELSKGTRTLAGHLDGGVWVDESTSRRLV